MIHIKYIDEIDEFESFDEKEANSQVDRIIEDYFTHKELDEQTKYILREDYIFKTQLLKEIERRTENITNNSTTVLFKELVTIINLLSLGNKYTIFEKYNEYSTDELSKLFRDYEALLKESALNNEKDFELTFKFYLALLKILNELCVVNSTDVKRKKSIKIIIELITESINNIKFTVALNEQKITKLSSFQSSLLINFSNILYISTENKSFEEILSKYEFIYNTQIDGYFLSQTVDISERKQHEIDFLANSTELLLLFVKKAQKYPNISFEKFSSIIELYNEYSNIKKNHINSIEEFKESLLNNLVAIYDDSLDINHNKLVEHILQNDKFSSTNIQIIHNYILYSQEINAKELEKILTYVITLPKMKNDYHEYHKLKAIDNIINKFIEINCLENFKNYVNRIKEYLDNTNTASQLLSVFSKIYLSLSYYYSLLGKEYIKKSQEQYFIAEKICAYTLIKDEYNNIFKKILKNNAQSHFDSINIINPLSKEELERFGLNMMEEFLDNQEIVTKYNVNKSIEKVTEEILKHEEYDKQTLEKHISQIISKEIFFGLAKCKIAHKEEEITSFSEIGYEILESPLINSYKILYKYSYSYKQSFNSIFQENESYIRNNVTNIILSYLIKTNKKRSTNDYLDEEFISYENLVHKFQ